MPENGNLRFAGTETSVSSDFYDLEMMSFSYYGTHQIILFKLNSEYAALYENSGTTSQSLTVPPTSIVNGYGIFTGINSDTLYIEVVEP